MNLGQYRALVAYLHFWPNHIETMNLDTAIVDIGITLSKADVISELFKAGHHYDEATNSITSDV